MEKISCHTGNNRCRMECCQRLHPQLVVFKKQRSSPLCEVLAVDMQWRYVNLHTHLQQKTISTLKHLL